MSKTFCCLAKDYQLGQISIKSLKKDKLSRVSDMSDKLTLYCFLKLDNRSVIYRISFSSSVSREKKGPLYKQIVLF